MSYHIFKYPLLIEEKQWIKVYEDAFEHLCLQLQKGIPTIWMECNPDETPMMILVEIHPTGAELDSDNRQYAGTFQYGDYVFHAYLNLDSLRYLTDLEVDADFVEAPDA